MSPKNPLLTVGLTALGFLGYAATRADQPEAPTAPPGPSSSRAPAAAAAHSVLLLSNGRMLEGAIAEQGGDVVIRQNGGEIRFKKSDVERIFGSVAEVYQYKLAQVPDRDPDEHMKLARWCLSQKLRPEAKAELAAVLALSPSNRQAKAMMGAIEADEVRAERPKVDPGLSRAGGVVVEPLLTPRAQPMDASAASEQGAASLPAIFDLPRALAVKRSEQFSKNVHPLLQAACARCHNERYSGRFQLVEVRNRRGLSADVIRANLDAALELIDPENPAKSELLSSVILPHGNGPHRRPIFAGTNDQRFQVLSAWVNSLRASKPGVEGAESTRFGGKADAGTPGFASDRNAIPLPFSPTPSTVDTPGRSPEMPGPTAAQMSTHRNAKVAGARIEPPAAASDQFPLPPMLGGPKPVFRPPGASPPAPKGPSPSVAVAPADALPESDDGKDLTSPPGSVPGKPKKPVKIDPSLLEKALKTRNGFK